MILSAGKHFFDFDKKTYLMGILNVTPDSFSDGGRFFDKNAAVDHAFAMAEEGADVIDVGGESTRPGSEPVGQDIELKRTIPVIEELTQKNPKLGIPISIDTYRARTAEAALEAGASIVNDISGLRGDPFMPYVVAKKNAAVIIMHMKGSPGTMQANPVYANLFGEIAAYLSDSIEIAVKAGVPADKILIDPGIGFGKTFNHNLLLLKGLGQLKALGKPIVAGTSRKAFIGHILEQPEPPDRLTGSLAAAVISVLNGANVIRAHDVKETAMAIKIADAVRYAN